MTRKKQLIKQLEIDYDSYEMVMDIESITPGWNSNNPNFQEFVPKETDKLCIEVGSWTGGSAKTISSFLDESSCLICCDTFLGSVEHFVEKHIAVPRFKGGRSALFEMFIKNTLEYKDKILPIQTTSTVLYDILKHYNIQPDFVYIDGDHAPEAVRRDLLQYYEVLAPGGVLLGDDYALEGVKKGLKQTYLDYTESHGQFVIRKI